MDRFDTGLNICEDGEYVLYEDASELVTYLLFEMAEGRLKPSDSLMKSVREFLNGSV